MRPLGKTANLYGKKVFKKTNAALLTGTVIGFYVRLETDEECCVVESGPEGLLWMAPISEVTMMSDMYAKLVTVPFPGTTLAPTLE